MARMRREAGESLRQSEQRLRMALTAARMVTWQWDLAADRVTISKNAADVFGLPPGTSIESSAQGFALIHPEDVERHRATVMEAADECGNYLSLFRIVRPDNGQVIWMEERGHAVGDDAGKAVRLLGVVQDITERHQAEEALREADRRKDEFLATLAHELRNPLAPLRNGLQIMKLARGNAVGTEQARAMMERQLAQLVRLVDDLMDVSRISRGKITLRRERVELARVIQQAVETSRPLIEANGHELTITVPPQSVFVEADPTRLAQVVSNLLNNAAKYTEHGGQITLTVRRRGNEVVISVRDTGVGIPPHMLPRIFEMFTQVDRSLERAQGGLGIGLTLVKQLVELHGGAVEAYSEGHGMGSEFVIRLPVLLSLAAENPPGEGEAAPPRAGHRVLVVDDNADAALSLALMLKIMGSDARTAHDGLEALDVAAAFRPDVILLDIGMPKLNGYEVCRRIRAQPWGKDLLIVALTGWGQDEDKRRAREAGFTSHLVKPLDLAALEKLLSTAKVETA